MSIFLDQGGQSDSAFSDLFNISRQDGNLGDTNVLNDSTVLQMTYDGTTPAVATAARIFNLINNNFPAPVCSNGQNIVVTALLAGIDPHSGLDVTGNGFTYVDTSSGTSVIRVVYDVTDCNGQGIFAYDTNGNQITFPRAPLLYHELSHAFRAVTCTQLTNDEPPAETDENVMRSELGLCPRDVNNHGGGCGSGNDCGGSSNGGCFIVTATTGSAQSEEVNRLRQLRDRVATASGLSAQLIDRVYLEYSQFSPPIAAQLQQDPIARQAVLQSVVRPLLAWYSLAATLAFDHAGDQALDHALQELSSACSPDLSHTMAALAQSIHTGEPLPGDAPQLLLNFAPKAQEAARFPYAAWAILDPLARAWNSAASGLDLVDQVSQWLATAPLEALTPPADPNLLDAEVGALASFFGFMPAAKHQLGEQMAAAWPDAAPALAHYGFVQ